MIFGADTPWRDFEMIESIHYCISFRENTHYSPAPCKNTSNQVIDDFGMGESEFALILTWHD